MRCQIDGCELSAQWTVVRPQGKGFVEVCSKCRDELLGRYGYHLIYNRGRVPDTPLGDDLDGPAHTTRMNLERVVRGIPFLDPAYHAGANEGEGF